MRHLLIEGDPTTFRVPEKMLGTGAKVLPAEAVEWIHVLFVVQDLVCIIDNSRARKMSAREQPLDSGVFVPKADPAPAL